MLTKAQIQRDFARQLQYGGETVKNVTFGGLTRQCIASATRITIGNEATGEYDRQGLSIRMLADAFPTMPATNDIVVIGGKNWRVVDSHVDSYGAKCKTALLPEDS